MGLILTLILGGLAGWIAGMIMRRDENIVINIIVGIVGAFLVNLLISPLIGVPAVLNELSLSGFILAVIGAVILLAIVNLITRKRVQ